MAYRATFVSKDPLNYFLQTSDEGPYLRVSDVVVRANLDPGQIFSRFIAWLPIASGVTLLFCI